MSPIRKIALAALGFIVLHSAGCGWSPYSQLGSLQSENQRLSQQTQAQLAEIANLKVHAKKVEDRLIETEEELALVDEQLGADRRHLARLARGEQAGGYGPVGSAQLAALAARHPDLNYDPTTGIAKLDVDVLFDSGEAELKPAARRMLTDFAALMQSPEAADLKLMVVGHTDNQRIAGRETRHQYPSNWHLSSARALAVADQLRTAGLSGDRLGVAGFGQHQPIANNTSIDARQQNRRVEIFLVGPDVPVVGMTETLTNLYY